MTIIQERSHAELQKRITATITLSEKRGEKLAFYTVLQKGESWFAQINFQ